ncbi:cytochrome P450 [Pholiota conissans]|uniref:Cytochrome P450 n=1 Tax=Pholiota conissans TaxID=109636 RepID=A0A9P5YYF5_9AGAR|nr:cytochrome P450 [Pholiota conissans]
MQYEQLLNWNTITILILLGGVSKLAFDYLFRGRRGPYPPGPPPKWFIGNMFDFPTSNASEVYAAWGRRYNSDILHASSLGNHVMILNNYQDAEELLDRRAAKYSDRPVLPIVNLMGWDKLFALFPHGDYWLRHRIVCKKNFGQGAVKNHYPVQLQKVHDLLRGLLDTPNDLFQHIQLLTISVPMMSMYGYDVKSVDDPCINAANQTTLIGGGLLLPGATFINVLPFLRHVPAWFPGASARKLAEEAKRYAEDAERIPMEHVEKCMADGTAFPSLVSDFLEKKYAVGATEEEERIIKNVAYTIYGGSSDTTMSSSETFFYLMATHPEVQRKAREEIDRVIGSKRLPDFEDRDSLPYVEAIYREVMRWNPPLPMAGPHRVAEDDWYKGYFVPKDTVVLVNLWAMSHNEDIYPEPNVFRPERHLNEDGTLAASSDISVVYGFGRRVCPGMYMGSSMMWLIIVSVLASFDIGNAKDANGKDIEIDHEYVNLGLTSRKKQFKCSFRPRSSTAQLLM